MFIIFGWGRQTVKSHGPVQVFHCDHCNNDKYWQLHTRRTWFTLFFIPIIPYSTEHMMLCPVCSYGVKLENDKFNQYKAIAECNMELVNKKITEEEHATRMRTLLSSGENAGNAENDIELQGKTETQKNYIRQMNEIRQEQERKLDAQESK